MTLWIALALIWFAVECAAYIVSGKTKKADRTVLFLSALTLWFLCMVAFPALVIVRLLDFIDWPKVEEATKND